MRNPHAASNVNDQDERQHRFTPRKLMVALHDEFKFTMDACGHPMSPASQIIGHGYTLVKPTGMLAYGDCYGESWHQHRVWLQPDFAKMTEAVEMAIAFIGCLAPPELIVLLMPWNRQEQPLWQTWIEPLRDGKAGAIKGWNLETRALAGRVKFGTPDDPEGVKKHPKMINGQVVLKDGTPVMMPNAPGFGCGLVIWRRNP